MIASPLTRAQQTAEPIAKAFGLPIDTDERLIEAGNAYEGSRIQSGPKDFVHPRNWWLLRNPARPSWGEPYREQSRADVGRDPRRGGRHSRPRDRDGLAPAAHLGGAHDL